MPNSPVTRTSPAARGRIGSHFVGSPVGDGIQRNGTQRQLGRLREVQKVRDHLPERFSLAAYSLHVRPVFARQLLEIEEAAVAVDGCETVSKLVRDAGGQLAETRKTVLEPQLLFELDDVTEVAEQADGAVDMRDGVAYQ